MVASHNSWSFSEPVKWWMKLFRFVGRCQTKTIQEQYDEGVRMFDLRINDDNVHHGLIQYKTQYLKDLEWLNRKNAIAVRVLYETNDINKDGENKFIQSCKKLEETYSNILFFGGQRKCDWKKIYTFKNLEIPIIHRYSSTTTLFPKLKSNFWRICDDWWPWLYSYITRKQRNKWIKEYKDQWLMLDFI